MAELVAPLLQIIGITSIFLVAGYAVASWREGSRSTRAKKSAPEPALTPISESRLAKLEAEMAELWSLLEKNTAAMSKLSSRLARRNERAQPEVPPVGASKTELRKFYGIEGKTPPEVARLHGVPTDGEK